MCVQHVFGDVKIRALIYISNVAYRVYFSKKNFPRLDIFHIFPQVS